MADLMEFCIMHARARTTGVLDFGGVGNGRDTRYRRRKGDQTGGGFRRRQLIRRSDRSSNFGQTGGFQAATVACDANESATPKRGFGRTPAAFVNLAGARAWEMGGSLARARARTCWRPGGFGGREPAGRHAHTTVVARGRHVQRCHTFITLVANHQPTMISYPRGLLPFHLIISNADWGNITSKLQITSNCIRESYERPRRCRSFGRSRHHAKLIGQRQRSSRKLWHERSMRLTRRELKEALITLSPSSPLSPPSPPPVARRAQCYQQPPPSGGIMGFNLSSCSSSHDADVKGGEGQRD
ncbi:hypothetical protein DAI22_01g233700 [Oryza sativa Japonica Group]|nr:hypothetical protein DAI22_01g233700 [Oryza sativa Japonica Group]